MLTDEADYSRRGMPAESGYDADAYYVFVFRLWKEQGMALDRPAVWRFSLEDIRTRERYGFGSLEGLITFLQERMEDGWT